MTTVAEGVILQKLTVSNRNAVNNFVEFYFALLWCYKISRRCYATYHKTVGNDLDHIEVRKDYYFIYFSILITAF